MSIELPATSRHHRNMTERLLKVTLSPNQTNKIHLFLNWTFPSLNLDTSTVANRDFCQNSKIEIANSVDPNEKAHSVPSHQDL